MARVLLLGHPPPPLLGDAKVEASHHRTWQLLEPLLEDGHSVRLFVEVAEEDRRRGEEFRRRWGDQLSLESVPPGRRGWMARLQRTHDGFEPDCVVAVNFDRCLHATRLRTKRPLWMDIFGDYLTIVQAACARQGSDRGLATSIAFVRDVLGAGDAFSACGVAQQHALVGELAMAGRLNARTFGYPFVHVVPPGARVTEPADHPAGSGRVTKTIAEAPFALLWCGGYNTWTDV